MENEEKIKKIKRCAIIGAALFPPVLLFGGIITYHLIGNKLVDLCFFIVCSIFGFNSFMTLCILDTMKENSEVAEKGYKKVLRVIGNVLMYSSLPFFLIGAYATGFLPEDNSDDAFKIVIAVWFLITITGIVIVAPSQKVEQRKLKVDFYFCHARNYPEWQNTFLSNAISDNYMVLPEKILEEGRVSVCIKEHPLAGIIECIAITWQNEMTIEFAKIEEEIVIDMLKEYYKRNNLHWTIYMMRVYCVDHFSQTYSEMVNACMLEGLKRGECVAGVSFDDQRMILAKSKDTVASARHNYYRGQIMFLARINESDVIKCPDVRD